VTETRYRDEGYLDRSVALENLETVSEWDLLVIGGGSGGLGVALAATLRGHRVLLLERDDFAAETSSRSTKLIHGGVRYLPQRRWSLLRESLRERRLLTEGAPDWVVPLPMVIPFRKRTEGWKYRVGLWIYEQLAGTHSLGGASRLNVASLATAFPWLHRTRFRGGWQFMDARFDDARFALALAAETWSNGGTVLNGVEVQALLRNENGRVVGVHARDRETSNGYKISARVVINAAGLHVDRFREDRNRVEHRVVWSRGSHLVIDRAVLPVDVGLLLPETADGRVLFVLPWHGHSLVGTTDVATDDPVRDPRPSREEVLYLLEHLQKSLGVEIERRHIRSAFAGIRTLVNVGSYPATGESRRTNLGGTADLSRESIIEHTEPGLISVLGGKWTTFRSQGIRAVELAEETGAISKGPCLCREFRLARDRAEDLFGNVDPLTGADPPTDETLVSFVRFTVRTQMARTVTDVLARRSRLLFVDVARAKKIAPVVAKIMAESLGKDAAWIGDQQRAFESVLSQFEAPEIESG